MPPPTSTHLLGVVPRAAHVVQEERHEDARDGAEHEEGREHFGAEQRATRRLADEAEDDADGDGHGDGEQAGQAHFAQRRGRDERHADEVVGLGLVLHDVGVLLELAAHLLDNLGGAADGGHGEADEVEDHHDAEQAADEHLGHGNVHGVEGAAGERLRGTGWGGGGRGHHGGTKR